MKPAAHHIPLVLGVVGHRKLRSAADAASLKRRLIDEIDAFKQAYAPTPIVVLSSLAQGADTLAAEAAQECGVALRAAIPMPPEVHRTSTSFDDESHRQTFDKWWQAAEGNRFVVPMPTAVAPPPEDRNAVGTSRAPALREYRLRMYANAGLYLVRHSDVLIALWDGEKPGADGLSGTAEHLALKLDGVPPKMLRTVPDEALGVFSERALVVVLHTPREGVGSSKPVGARDLRTPGRVVHDSATALGLLLTWIGRHFPHPIGLEPRPVDGLDHTTIPPGCEALFLEVRDGSEVAFALKVLWTADNPIQSEGDRRAIREKLAEYWAVHAAAVAAPPHHASWSGI